MIQRPKILPIKVLKKHLKDLLKKNNIEIIWGAKKAKYFPFKRRVNSPQIKSVKDYFTCLHEIGHGCTNRIEDAKLLVIEVNNKLKEVKAVSKSKKSTIKKLNKDLTLLSRKITKILNKVSSNKWRTQNETLAWIFAYQNSLVWDDSYKKYIIYPLNTYWSVLNPNVNKMNGKLSVKKYREFYSKYVEPIFTLGARKPDGFSLWEELRPIQNS